MGAGTGMSEHRCEVPDCPYTGKAAWLCVLHHPKDGPRWAALRRRPPPPHKPRARTAAPSLPPIPGGGLVCGCPVPTASNAWGRLQCGACGRPVVAGMPERVREAAYARWPELVMQEDPQ